MPPIPKAPPSMHDPKLLSRTHAATPDDDIVITGVSGKFPNSKNVEEFAHHLYNKVSFVNKTNSQENSMQEKSFEKNTHTIRFDFRSTWLMMKKCVGVISMPKFQSEWAKSPVWRNSMPLSLAYILNKLSVIFTCNIFSTK